MIGGTSMGGSGGYRAFLSYSHADEAAATMLHRALERYVLPRRVRKAHALPPRLVPIFRDVEDLEAAPGLTTRLQDALDQSQWLIVLCSRASAKSKYVNEEIGYFLGKHGANRILCVLLEGDPPECFPPAIRSLKEEPLAADLRAGRDEHLALIKLVAALAGVGFTELRNREAQRKRRRRASIAALAAGLLIGGLGYWDLFVREHVDYYVNYVRRNGTWEGIDRVSATTAARRAATYRFTRNGRLHPPRRVDFVNGSGHCRRDGMNGPLGHLRNSVFGWITERYCAVQFEYRESGALARETWVNNIGDVLDVLTHTEEGLVQFTRKGFASAEGGSGVFYIQSARDANGLDKQVQFLYSLGNPRPNELKEFGWRLDYDAAGRVVRKSVLDDQGKEIGVVTNNRYDDRGLLVEVKHTDLEAHPQVVDGNYSSTTLDYDDAGNVVRRRFFLPDGKPAPAAVDHDGEAYRTSGFSILEYSWDDHGNNVERRELDSQGHLVNDQLGMAVARMEYDTHGNIVRYQSFDASRRPVLTVSEGTASYRQKFDAQDRKIENRSFGIDGKPLATNIGIAVDRLAYDDQAHTQRECFFDIDDRPMMVVYGHCYQWSFDERGNQTALAFFDLDGKPYARLDTGVAESRIRRNDRGNVIGTASFGVDGKPVINRHTGTAGSDVTRDDFGNVVEIHAYDVHHRATKRKDGAAGARAKYDRSGNRIEETYFDENQLPTLVKDGYFGYRAQFDTRGRTTRKEFLDGRGAPMKVAVMHAFGVRYDYDNRDAVVAETYLDESGNDAGKLERRRNEFGWEIEDRYFDASGAAAPYPASGCTIELLQHDRFGYTTEQRCLDAGGKLVNRKDGGWAVKKQRALVNGTEEKHYFDAQGKEVSPLPRT